jgi:thiol-disulfide isomerase/thioredoxin
MNTWIIVLIVLVLYWFICLRNTGKPCKTNNNSPVPAPGGALPRQVMGRSSLVSRVKSKFGNMASKFNANTVSYSPDDTKMDNVADDTVLIFYAPWCGHCKRSMNDFKQAASMGNGKVILINSDEDTEAVKKYNVRGFPTIMKASGETYTGNRDVSSIMDFAKN